MRYDRTRAAELLLVVTLFVVYYAYIVRVYEPFTLVNGTLVGRFSVSRA
jgi:hypothetical protein